MDTIGERIKFARKRRKMRQEDLAESCGWEYQSRVSSYERDEREPGAEEIAQMATALRCSKSWLATGEGVWDAKPLTVSSITQGQAIDQPEIGNSKPQPKAKDAIQILHEIRDEDFDGFDVLALQNLLARIERRAMLRLTPKPDSDTE